MIHHIRPYRLFNLIDAAPSERVAQFVLPGGRGAGSVSVLETSLLLATLRVLNPKRIFEFGTFLGNTTLNLALNSSEDAKILTLDFDEQSAAGARQDPWDAPLTK